MEPLTIYYNRTSYNIFLLIVSLVLVIIIYSHDRRMLKSILHNNSIFICLWLVTVLALSVAVGMVDKATLHLALCDHHTTWADTLMPILSDLTHWLPYAVCAILLIWRWRVGVFVSGSLLISTAITQTLKHLVRAPRPFKWFADNAPDIALPLTEGVNIHSYLSFPSGHTTTYFCLFFALCAVYTYYNTLRKNNNALWQNNNALRQNTSKQIATPLNQQVLLSLGSIAVQVLSFLLATVCSYSRIYLSQHFAEDVLAGMIIGVSSVLIGGTLCINLTYRRSYSTTEPSDHTPQD